MDLKNKFRCQDLENMDGFYLQIPMLYVISVPFFQLIYSWSVFNFVKLE